MTTREWNANVIQLSTFKSFSIPSGFAKMIHSIRWGWSCGIVAHNCFPGSLSQAALHCLFIWLLSFLLGTGRIEEHLTFVTRSFALNFKQQVSLVLVLQYILCTVYVYIPPYISMNVEHLIFDQGEIYNTIQSSCILVGKKQSDSNRLVQLHFGQWH